MAQLVVLAWKDQFLNKHLVSNEHPPMSPKNKISTLGATFKRNRCSKHNQLTQLNKIIVVQSNDTVNLLFL